MFQNKIFLTILALGAIQATRHNKSYEVKPDCNKSYSTGHHKSGYHSHKSVYGGAYSLSAKDKIDRKNQGSWNLNVNNSIPKPERDLNNTDNIKDDSGFNAELAKNDNSDDLLNKDNIHIADNINGQNGSSPDNNNGIIDSSNIEHVKNVDSSKQIAGIQTGIPSKENFNTANGNPGVSGQEIGLDLNTNGFNKDEPKSLSVGHQGVEAKPININTNNLGSFDNNNLEFNNIKSVNSNQDAKKFNSINEKNEANLDIEDNKLEASENASNNINISFGPNQHNSGTENVKLNDDYNDQVTVPDSVSNNSNKSSNNTNGTPEVIPDLPLQEDKQNTKSNANISAALPKDKVDVNSHQNGDSDREQTYNQQSYGQQYHY